MRHRRAVMADSGFFYAWLDKRDAFHNACKQLEEQAEHKQVPIVAINFVVAEAHALMLSRLGRDAATAWRELEQDVMDLKTRLARLEAVTHGWVSDTLPVGGSGPAAPLEQTQLLAWLNAHGLVRDPTAEECRVAAEGDALSDEDKQAHIDVMQRRILEPPLSQIIIEQRRRRWACTLAPRVRWQVAQSVP